MRWLPEKIRSWPWDLIGLMALAALLRVFLLDLKQPHFDEGINGWWADKMREQGFYDYNPTNYHGPWYFYLLFLSQELFGRNLWALRLPAVLAGVLAIPVLFMFGRWFGRTAVRWAALAFAVSPAAVFYGRYSIHEPWFALFTMIFTWGVTALWLQRDKAGLRAAILGLAGMILNKETFIIHAGSLALAAVVFMLWQKISPLRPPLSRATARDWSGKDLWVATTAAVFLLVFFYSGNFLNFKGLPDMFTSLAFWTETGTAGKGHEKTAYDLLPFVNYYWLALFARYEWPALAGLLWSVRYAWPAPPAPRLLAIMAGGILLAYSVIPYKTPWCIYSIIWPFFLFFGAAASALRLPWRLLLAGSLVAVSLDQSLRLNFRAYENDAEPYVYVQTYQSIGQCTAPLLDLAAADPRVYATPGAVYLESYYPLPWMLGDFTQIGYHNGKIPDPLPPARFHLVETERAAPLREKLGPAFEEIRFKLRSGMDECSVFFERALLEEWRALRRRP